MADVTEAMVRRVVEKRNLNEVFALIKVQIESLAGHGPSRPYSLVPLMSLLLIQCLSCHILQMARCTCQLFVGVRPHTKRHGAQRKHVQHDPRQVRIRNYQGTLRLGPLVPVR
jgi:hypothetical protein